MCCIGKNFTILEWTHRAADFYAYEKYLITIEGVTLVNETTAWGEPILNQTYILVINETLYNRTKLDHSLINTNWGSSCWFGLWGNPLDKERGLNIDVDNWIYIPMKTSGNNILFDEISLSEQ